MSSRPKTQFRIILGVLVFLLAAGAYWFFLVYACEWRTRRSKCECRFNLRCLSLMLGFYADDNGGVLPETLAALRTSGFFEEEHEDALHCPVAQPQPQREGPSRVPPQPDYEYLGGGLKLAEVPASFPLVFDKRGNHPDGTRSVLSADGSCHHLTQEQFKGMLREQIGEYGEDSDLARRLKPHLASGPNDG